MMNIILNHLWRSCSRQPWFFGSMVFTIAVGGGAATAVFAIVDQTMLRRSPFANADRLVDVFDGRRPGVQIALLPGSKLMGWQAPNEVFERFEVYAPGTMDLSDESEPQRISVVHISTGMLELLGVQPITGRTFRSPDGDTGSPSVAIISKRLAQRRWPHWQDALGASIRLNGVPHSVIGIMEPRFVLLKREEVWLPVSTRSKTFANSGSTYFAIGLVPQGVGIAAAQERANDLAKRMQEANPIRPTWAIRIAPKTAAAVGSDMKRILYALLGASILLLGITAFNMSQLILARQDAYRQKYAIKAALGAGRKKLIYEVLGENVVISVAGAVGSLLIASLLLPILVATAPGELRDLASAPIVLDGRVMLVAALSTTVTSMLFGMLAAVIGLRHVQCDGLSLTVFNRDAAHRGRFAHGLVVLEIACAMALTVGAILMIRNVTNIVEIDAGFQPKNLLDGSVDLPVDRYPTNLARFSLLSQLRDTVRQSQGIDGVAFAAGLTFGGIGSSRPGLTLRPEADESHLTSFNTVSPEYFSVMGIPLVSGRTFTASDTSSNAIVINQTLANYLWGQDVAVGKSFLVDQVAGEERRTVIGVVGDLDVRFSDRETARFQMYEPWPTDTAPTRANERRPYVPHHLIVKSTNPAGVPATVKNALRALDPAQPFERVTLVTDSLREPFVRQLFAQQLLLGFALFSVLLAIIGVFSITARSVVNRTREIAIRIALGGSPMRVFGSAAARSCAALVTGLSVGIVVSVGLTTALRELLVGVSPSDAESVVAAVAIVGLAGLAAVCVPASRVVRVQPLDAMKDE